MQMLTGSNHLFAFKLEYSPGRLIESHYKIIYRVTEEFIYITDIFDSRQDPDKMKE